MPNDNISVMAGLDPAIHVLLVVSLRIFERKTWMPGTRFILRPREARTRMPGMTTLKASHT
jgi:hypothetical protein